jgi:transcription elongation factor Elf1
VPTYKYECDACGEEKIEYSTIAEHVDRSDDIRPHAKWDQQNGTVLCGYFKQVFSFRIKKPMPEHYSHTLDSIVSSEQDFERQLREKSRADSERHGFDVNYEPVDPGDAKAAGVKGEAGLESQERAHHDATSDGHKTVFS